MTPESKSYRWSGIIEGATVQMVRRWNISVIDFLTLGIGRQRFVSIVALSLLAQLFGVVRLLQSIRSKHPYYAEVHLIICSLAIGVLLITLRSVGKRTLSPTLHTWPGLFLASITYLSLSGILFALVRTLSVGTIDSIISPVTQAWFRVGAYVTTFAVVLSLAVYTNGIANTYPESDERAKAIMDWFDAIDTMENAQSGPTLEADYERLVNASNQLLETLECARMRDEKMLYKELQEWTTMITRVGSLSTEKIITGDTKKEERVRNHNKMNDLANRISTLGGGVE